jgi:predicted enzyme related to lactoylglutathione lyase
MSLRHCPLLYVFLETAYMISQRHTIEVDIGLPVIDLDDRPGVRHGVVNYDAGSMVVSLNLSSHQRIGRDGSDGLMIVFDVPRDGRGPTTDENGHHYVLKQVTKAYRPSIAELRLVTEDLESSCAFYRDVLDLAPQSFNGGQARFAAGAVTLVLERLPAPVVDQRARRDTYLLVFYTRDIRETCAALSDRGLVFKGRKVGSRDFGSTIHFDDPAGHRFCLYEPSARALATETGRKLRQVVAGCEGALPVGMR